MIKHIIFFLLAIELAHADPTEWLSLLRRGKDKEAAASISKETAKLRRAETEVEDQIVSYQTYGKTPYTIKSRWKFYDSAYVNLLKDTAQALNSGCDCDEDLKLTVFRGFRPNETDFNLGTKKRPLIASRGIFNNGRLQAQKLFTAGQTQLNRQFSIHGNGYDHQTMFISTSYSPKIANWSPYVMMLRVCPKRLLQNNNNIYSDEKELLLPFFIHPTELVAVIVPDDGYDISSGKFKVIGQGGSLSQLSKDEVRSVVQKQAQKNMRFFAGRSDRQFGYFFDKMRNRLIKKLSSAKSCHSAFSNSL